MANPVITGITFNKATYNPGEQILATVDYGDADNQSYTMAAKATDQQGNEVTMNATFTISDPVQVTVTDSGSRTWTKVSDNGSQAMFQAVA